jgi:hypothetical protein
MTDYVNLPNSTFDHDRLHLAPPNGLQGGSYFSMLYYKDAPLYIQTPKCMSRQGVVPGKRPYIDLMFSNHDVSFLEWLEALEADAVRLIHDKRNLWISSDIEKSDIEAGFTSPVRPYKGGKHYLIRAHIQPAKHLATGSASSCSVFDENERPVPLEYIKPEHQMYSVLEFQGIKFTARSFQMEVALKQVLLVPNVPLFQSCVIRRPSSQHAQHAQHEQHEQHAQHEHDKKEADQPLKVDDGHEPLKVDNDPPLKVDNDPPLKVDNDPPLKVANDPPLKVANDPPLKVDDDPPLKEATPPAQPTVQLHPTMHPTVQPTPPIHSKENEDALQEVNLDVLEELEHMHLKLKKPTQVYYEMYRIAKQKAKELKKNAIAAYLEAKQIKSAHMLEDSSDESDNDNDYDDDNDYGVEMHE